MVVGRPAEGPAPPGQGDRTVERNSLSLQEVWPSADWYERELWELYGIKVKGHEELGCFLLPEDWKDGFPMRRDWQGPDDFIPFPELEK